MNNLICLPIGKKLDELMQKPNFNFKKYWSKFNIDGLELTMAFKERIYGFKLNKEDKKWLKDLEYVSIHGPFKIINESKKEQIKILDCFYDLYDKVNAKAMLFHVHDCPYDLIDNYSWNIILENMPKKEKLNNKKATSKILKSKYGFCLDVCHAYTISPKEIEYLYDLMKNKLIQIHLSSAFRTKEHRNLSTASESFLRALKPVLKTNVPLQLEINEMWKKENILKSVNKELKFARKLFN